MTPRVLTNEQVARAVEILSDLNFRNNPSRTARVGIVYDKMFGGDDQASIGVEGNRKLDIEDLDAEVLKNIDRVVASRSMNGFAMISLGSAMLGGGIVGVVLTILHMKSRAA